MYITDGKERISIDDGFERYWDKTVLLGWLRSDENNNTIDGAVLAVGESDEYNAMWDLFVKYLMEGKHGEVYLKYFGVVDTIGVYL